MPQPPIWGRHSRDIEKRNPDSTLNLYRNALSLRRELRLGDGSLAWWPEHDGEGLVAFVNGSTLVAMNMGESSVQLPDLPLLLGSAPDALEGNRLRPNRTVWLRLD